MHFELTKLLFYYNLVLGKIHLLCISGFLSIQQTGMNVTVVKNIKCIVSAKILVFLLQNKVNLWLHSFTSPILWPHLPHTHNMPKCLFHLNYYIHALQFSHSLPFKKPLTQCTVKCVLANWNNINPGKCSFQSDQSQLSKRTLALHFPSCNTAVKTHGRNLVANSSSLSLQKTSQSSKTLD